MLLWNSIAQEERAMRIWERDHWLSLNAGPIGVSDKQAINLGHEFFVPIALCAHHGCCRSLWLLRTRAPGGCYCVISSQPQRQSCPSPLLDVIFNDRSVIKWQPASFCCLRSVSHSPAEIVWLARPSLVNAGCARALAFTRDGLASQTIVSNPDPQASPAERPLQKWVW